MKFNFRRPFSSQFLDFHTTTLLRDEQAIGNTIKELIANVPNNFLLKEQCLSQCTAKIQLNNDLKNKLAFWSLISSLILVASILGVQLEFSFLGFKLTDVTKLKEIILVGIMIASMVHVSMKLKPVC